MRLLIVLLCTAVAARAYTDIYRRTDLAHVVASDSRNGQIMLFTYVAGLARMWQDMAIELCEELNSLHYPYVVLVHDAASCADLLTASAGRVSKPPSCILDSVLHKTHGYSNSVLTLWVRRYHAAALFAEAGVSVTLLDADTIITRDFLPILKAYEKDYALIVLGEGPANGGLWHLRASNSSSAALWVIKQVERRSTLLEKYKVHDHNHEPGLHMDQDELGDALRVATDPDGSAFDFYGDWKDSPYPDHEVWKRFPQKAPSHGFSWKIAEGKTLPSPFLPRTCAWEPATCARFDKFAAKYELRNAPVRYAEIRVPFDSEQYDETAAPERVLNAPYWLFSHGDPLVNGFTDQIAVYHLLGVNLYWAETGSGSHASRYVQWLARPRMQTYRELRTDYVELSQHLVDTASAHADAVHIKHLVKHLMTYAVDTGRLPVLPRFSCNSQWIKRGNESYLGYEDHRVVDDGTWCYPSTAGFDSCFPGVHYSYPFLTPTGARVETLETLPLLYETSEQLRRAQTACPAFFKELE
jgi:hypothetical protein